MCGVQIFKCHPLFLSRPPPFFPIFLFSFFDRFVWCIRYIYIYIYHTQIHSEYIKLFFIIKVNTFKKDSWQKSVIVIHVISGRHYKNDGDFNTNLHKILCALVGYVRASSIVFSHHYHKNFFCAMR